MHHILILCNFFLWWMEYILMLVLSKFSVNLLMQTKRIIFTFSFYFCLSSSSVLWTTKAFELTCLMQTKRIIFTFNFYFCLSSSSVLWTTKAFESSANNITLHTENTFVEAMYNIYMFMHELSLQLEIYVVGRYKYMPMSCRQYLLSNYSFKRCL